MASRKKKVKRAGMREISYEIRLWRSDGALSFFGSRTNGRLAVREIRRRTKAAGPNKSGECAILWTTARGLGKRKLLHQCSTDASGKLSPRGEEL
jgi:hypothetical protein